MEVLLELFCECWGKILDTIQLSWCLRITPLCGYSSHSNLLWGGCNWKEAQYLWTLLKACLALWWVWVSGESILPRPFLCLHRSALSCLNSYNQPFYPRTGLGEFLGWQCLCWERCGRISYFLLWRGVAESFLLTSSYLIEVLFHGSHQGIRVQAKDKGHFSLRGLFQLPLITPKLHFLPYQPLFAAFLLSIDNLLLEDLPLFSFPRYFHFSMVPSCAPTHPPSFFPHILPRFLLTSVVCPWNLRGPNGFLI